MLPRNHLAFRVRGDHAVLLLALVAEVGAARAPQENIILLPASVALELDGAGGQDVVHVPTMIAGAQGFKRAAKGARRGVGPSDVAPAIVGSVGRALCCVKSKSLGSFWCGGEAGVEYIGVYVGGDAGPENMAFGAEDVLFCSLEAILHLAEAFPSLPTFDECRSILSDVCYSSYVVEA